MRLQRIFGALLGCVVLIGATSPASAESGRKYALLVGVQFYLPDSNLRKLKYAERDVEELRDVLVNSGWPKENVVLMTRGQVTENPRYFPTGKNIRKELDLLLSALEPNDTLMVAFAGHGVQLKVDGVPQSFFCPIDAEIKDQSTLIPVTDLYQELQASKAGLKLLLYDACRNNPFQDDTRRAEVKDLASITRPELLAPKGAAAFFSCAQGQVAYEHDSLGHGVFFHSVIEALKGKADSNEDKVVDLLELASFVRPNVKNFVRNNYRAKQFPELLLTSASDFPLVGDAASTRIFANSIGMDMVLIPTGEYQMGAADDDQEREPDELPRRTIKIAEEFRIGAHEVTVGQYRQFVKETNHNGSGGYGYVSKGAMSQRAEFDWSNTGFPQTDDHPVLNVSYEDAIAFCDWLSKKEGRKYRLPTEAEWEYVARAGSETRFCSGDSAESVKPYANLSDAATKKVLSHPSIKAEDWDDGFGFSAPVGSFQSNAFGLFDMHGNAWEWCADQYRDKNGVGELSESDQRVIRGGSWLYLAKYARSSNRLGFSPSARTLIVGFRVVCEP